MKKTLLFGYLLTLCNLTLFAQTGERPRIVHTTEKSAIHVPPQDAPAALQKIYSNLGTSSTDLYDDGAGEIVEGPNAEGAGEYFFAMQFTPNNNSHVLQVRVAVQYLGTGANQVNLNIYGDTNGAPGTLLAGPTEVRNLPEFGTCCALAVANFSPVAVIGGTQYWVVADTPLTGTGSDFLGLWDFVVQGKTPPNAFYSLENGSWYPDPSLDEPAGAVLGTIP